MEARELSMFFSVLLGGREIETEVLDPLNRPIGASFGLTAGENPSVCDRNGPREWDYPAEDC